MKGKIIVLILLLIITFSGCQNKQENGVPTYFLEPEGYLIAEVRVSDATLFYEGAYGYILEEDYQAFLNGRRDGVLVVKHPYEEGKEKAVLYGEITSITIGNYKDMR